MIYAYTSYRQFLRSVLAERIAANTSYSLRAFARVVEVSPSQLSHVLQGKKNLSRASALRVASKLRLNRRQSEYFALLVEYESAKCHEVKEATLARLREIRPSCHVADLSLDAFKAIADWHHIPILEMTSLERFEFSASAIASKLGISATEAQAAIDRLERLGLLEKGSGGGFRRASPDGVFRAIDRNDAIRRYHRQMLQKAIDSLTTQTPQEKFVGSETFSIDPALLPTANEIIEESFTRIKALFKTSAERSATYHLGIQLFNLTPSPPPANPRSQR